MKYFNYTCTDVDCSQYCAKINDTTFKYIEYREIPDGFVVCCQEIDLKDYTLDEIWSYCCGYYESFEQMVSIYGFAESLQIMAECIFEQMELDEMAFCAKQNTEKEAIHFISQWVKERS